MRIYEIEVSKTKQARDYCPVKVGFRLSLNDDEDISSVLPEVHKTLEESLAVMMRDTVEAPKESPPKTEKEPPKESAPKQTRKRATRKKKEEAPKAEEKESPPPPPETPPPSPVLTGKDLETAIEQIGGKIYLDDTANLAKLNDAEFEEHCWDVYNTYHDYKLSNRSLVRSEVDKFLKFYEGVK